jgi:hypothetical protein
MARIPPEELVRLKAEVSVEQLVTASGVDLKAAGKDLLGRCPFHEDREASLVVTPAKNLWHCFSWQIGGGPIDSHLIEIDEGARLLRIYRNFPDGRRHLFSETPLPPRATVRCGCRMITWRSRSARYLCAAYC